MSRSIGELKKIVLESQDRNELYNAEVELTELMAGYYTTLSQAFSESTKIKTKGELSLATTLKEICKERQVEVKRKQEDDNNLSNKLNYNFRMAARQALTKETYQRLWSLAQLPRKEVKEEKADMRKNRVSE